MNLLYFLLINVIKYFIHLSILHTHTHTKTSMVGKKIHDKLIFSVISTISLINKVSTDFLWK